MKKRLCMVLCAAVMMRFLCVTALAGGNETVESFGKPGGKERIEYSYGEDALQVYAYGGSKRDWVHAMAAAADGRIAVTGYTESSDGTLSDRVKTWRAGWVMMLDGGMNVMWNFCTRSGDADHMRFPVFQADGTLTVLHETEGKQIKIIRLAADGRELDSRTIKSGKREDGMYYAVGATEAGYLIGETENYGASVTYTLFDWKGKTIWQTKEFESISVVSRTHLIGRKNGECCCFALPDGKGKETKIAKVADTLEDGRMLRSYANLISLENGGAAACGSAWEEYEQGRKDETGLISCWDAQGNIVFEMHVVGSPLRSMVRTKDGFAALRIAQGEAGDETWELVRFDERGILCGTQKLLSTPSSEAGCAAAIGEEKIVCAQMTGLFGAEDVYLTIVGAK